MIFLRKLTGISSTWSATSPPHMAIPKPNPNLVTRHTVLPLRIAKLKNSLPHSSDDDNGTPSPGFSFSAAGLLFPYHLGAAQFLIENGYIKETTPLAGSSAGAIVCAVIASGASMQEALHAMKILAEDCRGKGTAFRLGVGSYFVDDQVKL